MEIWKTHEEQLKDLLEFVDFYQQKFHQEIMKRQAEAEKYCAEIAELRCKYLESKLGVPITFRKLAANTNEYEYRINLENGFITLGSEINPLNKDCLEAIAKSIDEMKNTRFSGCHL